MTTNKPLNEIVLGHKIGNRRELFSVRPKALLNHTLVVGQSGSGKSYLVARLLEEILLRTSARVVVLDPNGDFRKLVQVSDDVWKDGDKNDSYKELQHIHSLSEKKNIVSYDSEKDFCERWSNLMTVHLTADKADQFRSTDKLYRGKLSLNWGNLREMQDTLLKMDYSSQAKTILGLKACRDNLEWLISEHPENRNLENLRELIKVASNFANQNINLGKYEYVKSLTREHWEGVQARILELLEKHADLWYFPVGRMDGGENPDLCDFIDVPYARRSSNDDSPWDALLLGLDAAAPQDARLVAEIALWKLWENVKQQKARMANPVQDGKVADLARNSNVPTFIVVDEAHNFAPAVAEDELTQRVTQRLMQIASEGRKYGLYLILATQRPTKLHPGLVAECENQFVLRLQASIEHDFVSKVLGVPIDRARQASRFDTGQALIAGRFLEGSEVIDVKIAPARTVVGGGGVTELWEARNDDERKSGILRLPLSIRMSGGALTSAIRDEVLSILSESPSSVGLAQLAQQMKQSIAKRGIDSNWNGFGFAGILRLIERDSLLRVRVEGKDAWAYIEGKHDSGRPTGQIVAADYDLPEVVDTICRETDIPRLPQQAYEKLFKWLAEITDGKPFFITGVTKALRDRALENGVALARSQANFIVNGLRRRGHVFAADAGQSGEMLANVFFKNVLELSNQIGMDLSASEQREIEQWICGYDGASKDGINEGELLDGTPGDKPYDDVAEAVNANGTQGDAGRDTDTFGEGLTKGEGK